MGICSLAFNKFLAGPASTVGGACPLNVCGLFASLVVGTSVLASDESSAGGFDDSLCMIWAVLDMEVEADRENDSA